MSFHFSRHGMIIVLAIALLLVIWSLIRRNRSASSAISLDDLLLGPDNKISRPACVMMGSFILTTWTIVYLTLNDKLTEGYLGLYMGAWVAPAMARIFKPLEPPPSDHREPGA